LALDTVDSYERLAASCPGAVHGRGDSEDAADFECRE
jgi:hypothetical protein